MPRMPLVAIVPLLFVLRTGSPDTETPTALDGRTNIPRTWSDQDEGGSTSRGSSATKPSTPRPDSGPTRYTADQQGELADVMLTAIGVVKKFAKDPDDESIGPTDSWVIYLDDPSLEVMRRIVTSFDTDQEEDERKIEASGLPAENRDLVRRISLGLKAARRQKVEEMRSTVTLAEATRTTIGKVERDPKGADVCFLLRNGTTVRVASPPKEWQDGDSLAYAQFRLIGRTALKIRNTTRGGSPVEAKWETR